MTEQLTSYRDITVLPSEEITSGALMSMVMQSLHPFFHNVHATRGPGAAGVGFPRYHDADGAPPTLGSMARVFADERCLGEPMTDALSRLTDYLHLTGVRPVPEDASMVVYARRQPRAAAARAARRYAKRHGTTIEQALTRYGDPPLLSLPFFNTTNGSGERYRVFIERRAASTQRTFSTYGLGAPVPELPF